MIPGYLTGWLALIMIILFATGWKPYIAPRLKPVGTILLLGALSAAVWGGYWWTPLPRLPSMQLHLAVAVLLAVSIIGWAGKANKGHRSYLLVCLLMLSIIWGSIRSLYTHDPLLYWLEPGWNSSLLCGLLVCVFSTNIRYQSGVLLWCAALGDIISAWLDNGAYPTLIGSLAWWDSLSLALTAAYCGALVIYFVKQSTVVLIRAWGGMRRGRE